MTTTTQALIPDRNGDWINPSAFERVSPPDKDGWCDYWLPHFDSMAALFPRHIHVRYVRELPDGTALVGGQHPEQKKPVLNSCLACVHMPAEVGKICLVGQPQA